LPEKNHLRVKPIGQRERQKYLEAACGTTVEILIASTKHGNGKKGKKTYSHT
jgi:hypothetical protein